MALDPAIREALSRGLVIPAHPLALTTARKLDERRQRALSRYYLAAGAGGLAVGVHTTQFAIRDPRHGLYQPVLALAAEEMDRADLARPASLVRVAGVCGDTRTATREASLARDLGYHAGLLSLAALRGKADEELLAHVRAIAAVIPIFGFYLQPAVGGLRLDYRFWRRFVEIEQAVAIKIAPFNRYQTLDVVRAVAESGRDDIVLYTGNDDNIIADLLAPFRFGSGNQAVERRIAGGLLGQWAVGTRQAVAILEQCQAAARRNDVSRELLALGVQLTDLNAALFDAAHGFRGCIAGIHEVLRRQGLLEGIWCLDPDEGLSPGQTAEIDRVCRAYPHLLDDAFIAEHRDAWLGG
jgi:hypothetical protein